MQVIIITIIATAVVASVIGLILYRLQCRYSNLVLKRTNDHLNLIEAKLVESEKQYRQLISNLPHRFFIKDTNSVYLFCNEIFARDLGLNADDIKGKTDYELHPDEAERFHEGDQQVIKTKKTMEFEEWHEKDGRVWVVQKVKSPMFDDNGKVIGVLGIFWDITDKKMAEHKAKSLAKFPDENPSPIMRIDKYGHLLYANKPALQILGHENIVVNDRVTSNLHEIAHKALFLNKPFTHEIVHDNEIYSFVVTPISDSGYVNMYGRNITENIEKEKDLRSSNRALLALSGLNEAFITTHTEQELLDKACKIISSYGHYPLVWIGYAMDNEAQSVQPVAQHGFEIGYLENLKISWGDNKWGQGPTGKAIRAGKLAISKDIRSDSNYSPWRDSAAKHGYISSIALPLIIKQNVFGALNIYSNVHEGFSDKEIELLQKLASDLSYGIAAKRAILDKEKLQKQLQHAQKMEAIGQLTGGVAHDFNNILASIMGYTGLISESLDHKDEKIQHYISQVMSASERARDLVKQMLAFSRGSKTELSKTNLCDVIREAGQMLESTLPTSITFDYEIETQCPDVLANTVQLNQILLNLCINSRDAMDNKGGITIRLKETTFPHTSCHACHKYFSGDYVELIITDTGKGIDKSIRSRIFDPFFTTKQVGKGSGMGLAMVHGIVHEHGGHILVNSGEGKGTSFHILLPYLQNEKQSNSINIETSLPAVAESTPGYEASGRHILIIDDDESIAEYEGEILEQAGFKVSIVSAGMEKLNKITDTINDYDLILIDQHMPEITGTELAETLRRSYTDLPIILCTGNQDIIEDTQDNEIKINGLLHKPFTPHELLKVINDALLVTE